LKNERYIPKFFRHIIFGTAFLKGYKLLQLLKDRMLFLTMKEGKGDMKKRSRIAKIRLVGLVFTLSLGLAACSNNGEKKKSGSKGYEEYGSKKIWIKWTMGL
jgi:hypothetical protein